MNDAEVLIVGGGLAGLCCARRLAGAGVSCRVFEATYLAEIDARSFGERPGGSFFEAAGVNVSDGSPFQGSGFVRRNVACPRQTLQDALERIATATRDVH